MKISKIGRKEKTKISMERKNRKKQVEKEKTEIGRKWKKLKQE